MWAKMANHNSRVGAALACMVLLLVSLARAQEFFNDAWGDADWEVYGEDHTLDRASEDLHRRDLLQGGTYPGTYPVYPPPPPLPPLGFNVDAPEVAETCAAGGCKVEAEYSTQDTYCSLLAASAKEPTTPSPLKHCGLARAAFKTYKGQAYPVNCTAPRTNSFTSGGDSAGICCPTEEEVQVLGCRVAGSSGNVLGRRLQQAAATQTFVVEVRVPVASVDALRQALVLAEKIADKNSVEFTAALQNVAADIGAVGASARMPAPQK